MGPIQFEPKRLAVTDENPLSTEHFNRITILEELVCSPGRDARHFTFEPPESTEPFDGYHPELGPRIDRWQVILGDKGLLFSNHHAENGEAKLYKMVIEQPNFTELFKEFDTLKVLLGANGLMTTEPILCWIRGLIHAFMAENPNVVQCEATLTGTSGIS